jgi:predicted N-acyltransferase
MKSNSLRARIVTQLDSIDAREWDSVVSLAVMRHAAIRAFDSIQVSPDWVYALVYDASGPYAAIASRRHRGSPLLARVLMEVVPHLGMSEGIQLRRGVTFDAALPRLVPTLARMARRRGCIGYSVLVNESDAPAFGAQGFASFDIGTAVWSDISAFPSYDALLAGLPRDDRHELRRARRRSEQYGLRFEVSSPPRVDAAKMFALLVDTYAAHDNPLPYLPPFFERVWASPFADHVLFSAYLGERLVAAAWGYRDGDGLKAAIPVFDYEVARPSYAYFTLLDEIVRFAFAHRVRIIEWGPSNDAIKGRYGAASVRAFAAIRPSIPLVPGLWSGIRRLLRSDAAARAFEVPGRVEIISSD